MLGYATPKVVAPQFECGVKVDKFVSKICIQLFDLAGKCGRVKRPAGATSDAPVEPRTAAAQRCAQLVLLKNLDSRAGCELTVPAQVVGWTSIDAGTR
ncbi:MAG: hypothetical protein QOD02_3826 [Mycobacterium sp.]|nr:hypothetical protein [Mycobacterium sp.]